MLPSLIQTLKKDLTELKGKHAICLDMDTLVIMKEWHLGIIRPMLKEPLTKPGYY